VTANTTRLRVFRFRVRAFNRLYDFLVTLAAGLFSYFSASLCDVNVVFKPAGREIVGMPEPIARFSGILRNQSGRRVAIVANRNRAMARLQPPAKLILHDMTIHTRFGAIGHVRITTSVDECVRANTYRHSDRDTEDCSARKPSVHLCLLFWVAFDALKHRNVSQIDRMPKRFVALVASLAFPIRQRPEINRMLNVDGFRNTQRPR
jgi:hypothetical protein